MTVSLVSRVFRWFGATTPVTVTVNNYTDQAAVMEESMVSGERQIVINIGSGGGDRANPLRPRRVSR